MQHHRPKVSVIVPFYNEARHIGRCADALLSQSLPRDQYEVILVDNDSNDGSATLAQRPGVTVLHEPRRSSYAARNRGVEHARGDLLVFTDGDCAPEHGWLETILVRFEDPTLALLIGERRFANDTWLMELLRLYEGERARLLTYGYTNNMAMRAEVFRAVGPFEEIPRGADTSLFLRALALHPEGVVFAPEVVVRHLEVKGLGHHLRKKVIYGLASRTARAAAGRDASSPPSQLVAAALPHLTHHVPALSKTIAAEHGLSVSARATLIGLGWANYLAYGLGRLGAELKHRPR